MEKRLQSFEVDIVFEGKKYSASYTVSSDVVMVDSSYGYKSAQVDGSKPDMVACWLFQEILQDAKSRGELAT
ncbi:MAG TPA: hypothetical protein DCZ94_17755 [Lentisphaeria bacterium]|nr:MAG: hypothetical protein A2X48_00315 [Lentisphaerae bacterium GWF2_49_21]HBC88791.1 hypothetical protein [Lentisphaeria bacterium]